ncbi:MAG: HEPN domain-containing protein [Clostridia bacterium]|nr:HEPN domain-containing protein [Clostridia bacterium]
MMRQEHRQWLDFAAQDLGVSKHLFAQYRPMPLEIICYQCQQCAEKALKALYIYLSIPGGIPRTHDLSLLLDQMRNTVRISDDYYDLADRLTPYGIAARYPGNIQFSEYSARKAIEAAEAILDWVQTQIGD